MKIRNGFVSNSSSSSFVIAMDKVSDLQLEAIHNHSEIQKNLPQELKDIFDLEFEDSWGIDKKGQFLTGTTMMDNFNMVGFLKMIGIDDRDISWDEGHYFDLQDNDEILDRMIEKSSDCISTEEIDDKMVEIITKLIIKEEEEHQLAMWEANKDDIIKHLVG